MSSASPAIPARGRPSPGTRVMRTSRCPTLSGRAPSGIRRRAPQSSASTVVNGGVGPGVVSLVGTAPRAVAIGLGVAGSEVAVGVIRAAGPGSAAPQPAAISKQPASTTARREKQKRRPNSGTMHQPGRSCWSADGASVLSASADSKGSATRPPLGHDRSAGGALLEAPQSAACGMRSSECAPSRFWPGLPAQALLRSQPVTGGPGASSLGAALPGVGRLRRPRACGYRLSITTGSIASAGSKPKTHP